MATRVRVDHVAIQSMFVEGGQVHDFGKKLRRTARIETRRAAPRRSGDLRRSIYSDLTGTNQFRLQVRVKAYAEHALWVNNGTWAIDPVRADKLVLYAFPPLRSGIPFRYQKYQGAQKDWVHGQVGQHYMEKGLARAMARHGLF